MSKRIILFALSMWVSIGFAQTTLPVTHGYYEIMSRMVLPHIDDNHTNSKIKQMRYLEQIRLNDLFTILSHPSFDQCLLVPKQIRQKNQNFYALKCDNSDAASGQAKVFLAPNSFTARLDIKMGAKNMTLSQQVIAHKLPMDDSKDGL